MQFSFLSFILAFFLPILGNQFGVHHLRVHVPFILMYLRVDLSRWNFFFDVLTTMLKLSL